MCYELCGVWVDVVLIDELVVWYLWIGLLGVLSCCGICVWLGCVLVEVVVEGFCWGFFDLVIFWWWF